MPIPLIPLIQAGGEILSAGINAVTQGAQNRKNREFAREQYATSRADALADYAMQNDYNSPASQMARLKAAGLNPNLVYGNGAATQAASQIKSAPQNSAQGNAPRINNPGMAVASGMIMSLQADNLKAQNNVLLEQAKNIAQDTLNKKVNEGLGQFKFDFNTENRNRDIYRKEQTNVNLYEQFKNLQRTGALTDAQTANTQARTQTENSLRVLRAQAMTQNISESMSRMATQAIQRMRTQAEVQAIMTGIQNAIKDGKIKDYEIKLNNGGVQKNDPAWLRLILGGLQDL